MNDTPFVEVVTETDLARRVAQLGEEITADLEGADPVVLGVLKGSVPFMADLVRTLDFHLETDFLSLTRYDGEGRVGIALDTAISLRDRNVLIVEDIVDTGLTLTALHRLIAERGPASIRTVALLDKAPRRIVDVAVEYRGFEVGDEFLLGYGLDWEGLYRNVRSLWAVMDLQTLTDDPHSFAEVAHPRQGSGIPAR